MATTVKEVLDTLSIDDRALLTMAVELEICQFIRLKDSRYIGVNCNHITSLKAELQAGVWSVGTIHQNNSLRTPA